MGEILGAVVKGVKAAREAKAAIGSNGSGGDPGLPPMASASSQLPAQPGAMAMSPLDNSQPQDSGNGGHSALMTMLLGGSDQDQQPREDAPQAPAKSVDNPYATDTPQELAKSMNPDADVVVTGDRWTPKKESVLGQIGDALLLAHGRRTVFRDRTDQANMESAMQGFQDNPETAINRIRRVDPSSAWKMYEDLSRVRANTSAAMQNDASRMEKGGNILGSMLGAVTNSKDPAGVYDKVVPTLKKYADHYGYPSDMIPDKYDPDTVNTLRQQGIPDYQQERLKQYDQGLQDLSQYRDSRLQDYDQSLGERTQHDDATLSEHTRHNLVTERQKDKTKAKPLAVYNQQTKEQVGVVSPDGTKAKLRDSSGKWAYFQLRKPGDITSRVPVRNPDGTPKMADEE